MATVFLTLSRCSAPFIAYWALCGRNTTKWKWQCLLYNSNSDFQVAHYESYPTAYHSFAHLHLLVDEAYLFPRSNRLSPVDN